MVICDDIRMVKSLKETNLAVESNVSFLSIVISLNDILHAIFAEGKYVIHQPLSSLQQSVLSMSESCVNKIRQSTISLLTKRVPV
jgi:hypothetical protein